MYGYVFVKWTWMGGRVVFSCWQLHGFMEDQSSETPSFCQRVLVLLLIERWNGKGKASQWKGKKCYLGWSESLLMCCVVYVYGEEDVCERIIRVRVRVRVLMWGRREQVVLCVCVWREGEENERVFERECGGVIVS